MLHEYRTAIGDDIASAEQLDEESEQGWNLVQIIPYFLGSTNMKPGQVAHYFRRLKVMT